MTGASGPSCWRASAPRSGSAPARPRRSPTTSTWWSPRRAGRRPPRSWPRPLERGVPVWGEVELGWRLRDPASPAPWLAVTGTNGKTTTVRMLEAMLRAAGLRAVACGNVGLPIVEAVMDPEPYDVLAVELSSFQLHWTHSVRAESAVVLNVAEDHLDWYSGPDGMRDYARDKGRIYEGVARALRLQRRGPGDRGARAGRRGAGGGQGDRLHARHARRGDARHRRRRARRPRVRRGPPDDRRRAVHPRRPRHHRAALRGRRPGRRGARPLARRRPGARAPGAAGVPARRPPDRRGGRARRRHLGRRLQGHQPARRAGLACAATTPSCGSPAAWPRARASTTSSSRSATGSAVSCCSAATPRWCAKRSSDTHRMSR